jgi:thioredoxin 1
MGHVTVEVQDNNFQQTVISSDKPVIVDFWAQWCGPCLAIAPMLEELATEYQGKITIGKMDVDANSAVPTEFGIRNIPTLLFFKDGKMVDKVVGAIRKDELKKKIEAQLA